MTANHRNTTPFFPLQAVPGSLTPMSRGRVIRNLHGLPAVLARLGSLELRLATTRREIRKAQRLRWEVFVQHGNARVDYKSHLRRRDICPFDRLCDHLIVVDHAATGKAGKTKARVVGTYRLLRQDTAEANAGFYSAREFDTAGLLARHPGKRFMELGRSCILPQYRARRVLELLWRGLWIYAQHHEIDVMMGCASLPGTQPRLHASVFSGIARRALAQDEWHVEPLRGANLSMRDVAAHAVAMDEQEAGIPPLIKGYLRLGAQFGEGIFIDWQFCTTDVFVILPVASINRRYVDYFSTPPGGEQQLAA